MQLVQGTEPFGWLIVAKPEAELREQWLTLLGRLALALAVGVGLAATPVPLALATSDGARSRADPRHRGRCSRALRRRDPGSARSRRDRASQRAVSRHGRAARRGRAAQAVLPHVRLARAADAADRDPWARRSGARGHRQRARSGSRVARHRRCGDGSARTARRRRPRSRQAPGPPLHGAARGGRPRACARPGIRCVRRGGTAARDRLLALGRGGRAGDRVRRRSRAPGDHEPALERVPLDARRRSDRATARGGERRRLGRRRRLGAGRASGAAHADLRGLRLRRMPKGRDLDCPIARELAVALGGGIELGSNADAGSRFRLVLPVAPAV